MLSSSSASLTALPARLLCRQAGLPLLPPSVLSWYRRWLALAAESTTRWLELPRIADGESPTQTVGGTRSEMFDPVEHLQRMYSLDNVFDVDELDAWFERVRHGLGVLPSLLCELKIDGLAVDAVYVDGALTTLATRGDGRVGGQPAPCSS